MSENVGRADHDATGSDSARGVGFYAPQPHSELGTAVTPTTAFMEDLYVDNTEGHREDDPDEDERRAEFYRWLDKVKRQARIDVRLAFFERFKATGSISVIVIKKWWMNQTMVPGFTPVEETE